MNARQVITFLFSLGITVLFLVLALYPVDFGRLARAFATANYGLVALAACFTFSGYVLRTARWQRLLAPTKELPITLLFPHLVLGFALNNLLPGRPGEFTRAYTLSRKTELSKTLGFATVVFERVSDGLALIAFLLIALAAFIPLGLVLPLVAERIAAAASLLFGVAIAGMVFLIVKEPVALRLFRLFTRWLPSRISARLDRMLGSFTLGLRSLRSSQDMLAVALLSLAVWTCEGTSYLLVLSGFGLLPDLPSRAVAAAFMMVLINLGIMIPAAPGGIGPFEAAGIFALGTFGMSETAAASVALAAHGMQYLLITGMGLLFVWREGFSLAQTTAAATEDAIASDS